MASRKNHSLIGSLSAFALAGIGCVGEVVEADQDSLALSLLTQSAKEASSAPGKSGEPPDDMYWENERAARQAKLDEYLYGEEHGAEWQSFKNVPLGNTGVPTIMLRLFPEIFPEIWGSYASFMVKQGFGPDGIEPGRTLPLGLGRINSTTFLADVGPRAIYLQSSSLSCAGCHLGRVDGPDGQTIYLPGAPNGQFGPFRGSVYATVINPGYTADAFRQALAALPFGAIYPEDPTQEAVERRAFMANAEGFLAALRAGSIAGAQRYYATITTHTNAVPNPPAAVPGNLDAIAAGFALVVNPAVLSPAQVAAVLPKAPAPVDIMSVWRQVDRDSAQWDGSIPGKLHRNLAAELGVIGNPAAVNVENGVQTTAFTENLPAPPYPFKISRSKMVRGRKIFEQKCASCHVEQREDIFSVDDVGTDANRAQIWTDYTVAALGGAIASSCQGSPACDGQPSPVIRNTGGYMAVPLTGIWASAPYLHNGSVPTLRALLTGDRPDTFCRGNTKYDQVNVGFSTDCPEAPVPGIGLYDTRQSGNSNTGHTGARFNGYETWNEGDLEDLLAYLKSL